MHAASGSLRDMTGTCVTCLRSKEYAQGLLQCPAVGVDSLVSEYRFMGE